MPGTVLGAEDTAMKKAEKTLFPGQLHSRGDAGTKCTSKKTIASDSCRVKIGLYGNQ